MRYFIDTAIFVYAAGKPHPYKEPSVFIETLIAEEKIKAVISTETIQEILYHYKIVGVLDKGILAAKQVKNLVTDILSIDKLSLNIMIDVMEAHPNIDPRDALHIAVMKNNGIDKIMSTDKGFDLVQGIERIDPVIFLKKFYSKSKILCFMHKNIHSQFNRLWLRSARRI